MPYNLSALPADADDIKRYLRRDLPCAALPRCPSPRRRHARDVRYVGGFYGNASEEAMLRELANNGPVPRAIRRTSGALLAQFCAQFSDARLSSRYRSRWASMRTPS